MSPRESAPCPTGVQEVLARFDPDALLAQILMASPYPLEVVEATRWVKANPNLKDQALEDALQNQRLQHPLPPLSRGPVDSSRATGASHQLVIMLRQSQPLMCY